MTRRMQCNHKGKQGFSLIELLVVMAIMVLMMTMAIPSIASFSSTAGRRGAVNSLMNGFEQARAVALESGRPVYVVMRRDATMGGQDAFLVIRDDRNADLPDNEKKFTKLTKWQKLPKGVLFFQATGSLTAVGTIPTDISTSLNDAAGEKTSGSEERFIIVFNRHGQVSYPASGLDLYLAEAQRSGTNANAQVKGASLAITEKLSFRKYTGRVQLDFAAPPST